MRESMHATLDRSTLKCAAPVSRAACSIRVITLAGGSGAGDAPPPAVAGQRNLNQDWSTPYGKYKGTTALDIFPRIATKIIHKNT